MSKVLRTIAKVATVVAAVAKFIPGVGQVVAAVATAVALVAGTLATVTAKKPSAPGVTNQFVIDPQAGIPYCIGRTFTGGRIVHVDGYGGTENPYRSYVVAFSGGGPCDSIESVLVDRSPVSVGAGGASGYYNGFMWLSTQLGATPEASALSAPFAGFPGWGSSHKLSGYAAGLWTLKFDKKGKKFASGQPEFGVVGKWVKVYDPRLDSTFPGGSGPCRALQENTYVWSQNGPLHALTWALGRWQNSKRALGVGIEAQDIDLQAFVDAANVFDANGWAVGGVMDGSGDKWNTLRTILWAGAAEPLDLGGLLSCRYESPKVSLATITGDDLADGDIVVPAMKTWRDRINSIIPRYRSEAHNWEIIPASAVRGTTYIAEDGEERTRESEYYCCQSLTQAAQLAAYEIALSREIDGISIPLKTKFIGYKPGDCLTLNIPEANLNNQPAVVTNRTLDPVTGIVTMTFRTETSAKHAWALGRTSSAPPSPAITSSAVMDALIWNNRAGIPEERFNPLSTYDFGRIVNLANGARYIYVNDTATAGNAPPNVGYWTELSPATMPGDIGAATVGALSALASAKSTVTFGFVFPAAGASQENDMFVHLGQGRKTYRRVAGDGFISIGGSDVTIDGEQIELAWTPADDDRIGQAILDAAGAAAIADGKVQAFVTFSASDPTPVASGVGDIWVKRHLTPVEIWTANAALNWEPSATYGATASQASAIAQALADAATAQETADGKIETYLQPSMPTNGTLGDLWFDTDDGNKLYRHNGTTFVIADDTRIGQAVLAAAGAQATADGRVSTFYTEAAPTANALGDLWYQPSTAYLRRWDGDSWEAVSNIGATASQAGAIAQALADAATAQGTASAKSTIYYQATAPDLATSQVNDRWVNTSDGNREHRRVAGNGEISIGGSEVTIGGSTILLGWTPADDNRISQAIYDAAGAQATADGKINTFRSEVAPTAQGAGDLWHQPSTGNLYRWNGTSWELASTIGATPPQIMAIETAQNTATSAQADATSALGQIGNIIADGVLDKSEKPDLVLRYAALLSEQAGIQGNAVYYGITTERTTYDNAITALTSYLTGLSPAYNNYSADTAVTRATFNAMWEAAYNNRQTLLNKIAEEASRNVPLMTLGNAAEILCDYQGTPKSGQLPRIIGNIRKRGNLQVDHLTTWTATFPGSVTGTINTTSTDADRGDISITALTADGEITVSSVYDGVTLTGKVRVTRTLDPPPPPPPSSGGSQATSNASQETQLTTYPSTGLVLGPVAAGSSGQIRLEAYLEFWRRTNGSNGAFGKWGYATSASGPFTDIPAGEIASTANAYRSQTGFPEPELIDDPGSLSIDQVLSGLTNGTDYWFEFRVRKNGTNNTQYVDFYGTKTVTRI